MQSHRELDVWKVSMVLAMPKQEEYRLTSQMLRASVSIAAPDATAGPLETTERVAKMLTKLYARLKETRED